MFFLYKKARNAKGGINFLSKNMNAQGQNAALIFVSGIWQVLWI